MFQLCDFTVKWIIIYEEWCHINILILTWKLLHRYTFPHKLTFLEKGVCLFKHIEFKIIILLQIIALWSHVTMVYLLHMTCCKHRWCTSHSTMLSNSNSNSKCYFMLLQNYKFTHIYQNNYYPLNSGFLPHNHTFCTLSILRNPNLLIKLYVNSAACSLFQSTLSFYQVSQCFF